MMSADETLAWLRGMKKSFEDAIEYGTVYWPDEDDIEALEIAIAALEEKVGG